MDVGLWLRSLGLGQYEAAFRDNEVDGAVLPKLTAEDLKDLGVAVVGHRRKIISAIEELNAASSARAEGANAVPTQSHVPVGASSAAERRPITVMFCDLVGSTSLAAQLDAEDWRNLVSAYLDEASQAVTGFGGHVLKRLGDGLMALFGYPHAQENDGERAVRAALAIQRGLAELNARNAGKGAPGLAARIGLNSGAVVVDATGEVFGDAPNIAARVQGAAEPGSILITATVQRQTAGLFVAEDRGGHELKGVSAPVTLYRIVRASGGGRRGGARALTPLVGRGEELELLSRRWERARNGEGQLALVIGEPGIGKSRLIEEFRARLGETPHTWVEWSSSQLLQNTPLHPIAEWGRLRFGGADAPDGQRLADLENTLALIGLDPAEYAPLIAPLVDVPLPEDRRTKFASEELRRRQLAAMTAWVLAGARNQPAVIAFEDLHWADPTSLDLMRALAERGAQVPLFVIATTRPEFRPGWSVRSHHSVISLAPLNRAQVARMVGELASHHALSKDVIEGVNERTGGVPLFVEEVTRLLLERGVEGGAQAIPPTLQQSLAARLDRLGSAREIAQIGAVLGRGFSHALLQAVAGLDEAGLQSAFGRLVEADILFVEGDGAQANYLFKHALIQDAAYESLLRSRRQALHRRAAEILRESASPEPEAVAHHFTEAGLDDLAIEWWGKAGDHALRRSAFQEAISHLGKAIAMADKTGSTAPRATGGSAAPNQRVTQLRVAYGNALIAARGYGAPETTEAFARARESAHGEKDAPQRLAVDYGLWAGSYTRGELSSMRAQAAAFLSEVEASPDSPEACVAHRTAGITHWFAGEYREARDQFERALALFQPGRDDDLAFRFGADPGVAAMLYLAIALWPLGDVARAISLIDHMQARMANLTHVGTHAYGKMHAAMFELMRGDHARAAPNAFELARLAQDHDLNMWRAYGVFLQGWATAASGAPGDGLEGMRRGAEQLREQNVPNFDGLFKIALAEAEDRAGDSDRAVAILDEALATCDRMGHRAFEVELHRARGEILLKRDPANPAPAEDALLTAIAVAKQQATRSFELRAALSLAKLYQSTGRPADAHAVLAPALEGFAPTLEMPEIAEAEARLAALSQTDEVKAQAAQRQRVAQLHIAYGNALIAARGFGAPETTEAFARARQSAFSVKNAPERLAADFGLWAGSYTRGELSSMRAQAAAFLAEARPDSPEAGVAHRIQGITHWFAGEFVKAGDHLERALALFQPGRDDEMAFRFGPDPGVAAMAYLAFVLWSVGKVDRAVSLIERMRARIVGLTNANTLALGAMHAALFAMMRGDRSRARTGVSELTRIVSEHDLPLFRAFDLFLEGWAIADDGLPAGGLESMRRGAESLREQNVLLFNGLIKMLLSEAEALAGDPERAVATLDEALTTSQRAGFRTFEAELHRVRGEILLKRDPSTPAPAEDAFLTAVAVAKQQGTRSFGLRAALSLAKLYQSTGRPLDAHAVLAPALEGLSPTPEMPEIAAAQALLAALEDSDEVKADAARRQQRLHLQTGYAQAVGFSRGFLADETRAAFEEAGHLASREGGGNERFAAYYGRWVVSFAREEIAESLRIAGEFLRDAESEGRDMEAGAACRALGLSLYVAGDFESAQARLDQAIRLHKPNHDDDSRRLFGYDPQAGAMAYLACLKLARGELSAGREMIEAAVARADELGHIPTRANAWLFRATYEAMRGDPEATLPAASTLLALSRQGGLALYVTCGEAIQSWARARLGELEAGTAIFRQSRARLIEQGGLVLSPFFAGLLGELDAERRRLDGALALAEETLARAAKTGSHFNDSTLHRLRGQILLLRDSTDPVPAEDAYRTAIAIAKQQGARRYDLLASHSLAKLYQSTGRPVEARAVLAPALGGFTPTPEMPEIGDAQTQLEQLGAVRTADSPRKT